MDPGNSMGQGGGQQHYPFPLPHTTNSVYPNSVPPPRNSYPSHSINPGRGGVPEILNAYPYPDGLQIRPSTGPGPMTTYPYPAPQPMPPVPTLYDYVQCPGDPRYRLQSSRPLSFPLPIPPPTSSAVTSGVGHQQDACISSATDQYLREVGPNSKEARQLWIANLHKTLGDTSAGSLGGGSSDCSLTLNYSDQAPMLQPVEDVKCGALNLSKQGPPEQPQMTIAPYIQSVMIEQTDSAPMQQQMDNLYSVSSHSHTSVIVHTGAVQNEDRGPFQIISSGSSVNKGVQRQPLIYVDGKSRRVSNTTEASVTGATTREAQINLSPAMMHRNVFNQDLLPHQYEHNISELQHASQPMQVESHQVSANYNESTIRHWNDPGNDHAYMSHSNQEFVPTSTSSQSFVEDQYQSQHYAAYLATQEHQPDSPYLIPPPVTSNDRVDPDGYPPEEQSYMVSNNSEEFASFPPPAARGRKPRGTNRSSTGGTGRGRGRGRGRKQQVAATQGASEVQVSTSECSVDSALFANQTDQEMVPVVKPRKSGRGRKPKTDRGEVTVAAQAQGSMPLSEAPIQGDSPEATIQKGKGSVRKKRAPKITYQQVVNEDGTVANVQVVNQRTPAKGRKTGTKKVGSGLESNPGRDQMSQLPLSPDITVLGEGHPAPRGRGRGSKGNRLLKQAQMKSAIDVKLIAASMFQSSSSNAQSPNQTVPELPNDVENLPTTSRQAQSINLSTDPHQPDSTSPVRVPDQNSSQLLHTTPPDSEMTLPRMRSDSEDQVAPDTTDRGHGLPVDPLADNHQNAPSVLSTFDSSRPPVSSVRDNHKTLKDINKKIKRKLTITPAPRRKITVANKEKKENMVEVKPEAPKYIVPTYSDKEKEKLYSDGRFVIDINDVDKPQDQIFIWQIIVEECCLRQFYPAKYAKKQFFISSPVKWCFFEEEFGLKNLDFCARFQPICVSIANTEVKCCADPRKPLMPVKEMTVQYIYLDRPFFDRMAKYMGRIFDSENLRHYFMLCFPLLTMTALHPEFIKGCMEHDLTETAIKRFDDSFKAWVRITEFLEQVSNLASENSNFTKDAIKLLHDYPDMEFSNTGITEAIKEAGCMACTSKRVPSTKVRFDVKHNRKRPYHPKTYQEYPDEFCPQLPKKRIFWCRSCVHKAKRLHKVKHFMYNLLRLTKQNTVEDVLLFNRFHATVNDELLVWTQDVHIGWKNTMFLDFQLAIAEAIYEFKCEESDLTMSAFLSISDS